MGNTFSHFGSCSGELSTSPQPGFFELSQRLWALWATRSVVSNSRAERPARTWFKLESEAVDGTELNRSEVHRGVAVIIFMQADHFADQWPGDENQLALPFNLAVAADPAQFEVAGVDRICEPGRIGSRRCWAASVAAGGRAVSALRVLCMRSCRPFCWGWPGIMRTGVMPSLIHHTDSRLKPPAASEAKGGPLSESSTCGKQHSRKSRSNSRRQPS